MSAKAFAVFLDEVKQNFVFGELFVGSYVKTVTLSDGSTRRVKLTPMTHQGREVVQLDIDGHITYMGRNSTTTNCGTLMVAVRECPPLEGEGMP